MKIRFLFLILLFHSFIYSCNTADFAGSELKISIKSVSIPIQETHLNSYQILHAYQENGKNKLLTYNNKTHSLNTFDLDATKVIKDIPLSNVGPHAIGKINSLYFHNSDSIFLYERGKLHISNSEGQLVDSYSLYEMFDVARMGEPILNYYFKLNYNSQTKNVLFNLIQHKASEKGKSEVPKIGLLNIENKQAKLLPISHTDYFKSIDGKTGFLSNMGFHDNLNGEVLYNFQYESSIFTHNLETGKIKSASGTWKDKPNYVKALPASDDPENFETHALESTHYLAVIPDKWRGLVYRFNWQGPNLDFENASWTEKSTSISIFDEDLNYIQDYPLPDHTYQINNWFVNENGLYLDFAHPKNEKQKEDFLIFHIIKFNRDN